MIQKKICMLGAFAVGKTSLVTQFVRSMFSERYHTTVGVKIDKKVVHTADGDVNLILWDLAGEDEFQRVHLSYLRGASGYLLVVDGTRPATLEIAMQLHESARTMLGDVPFIVILNKADLTDDWEIEEEAIGSLTGRGWEVVKGSAKTGEGVEHSFSLLVRKMLGE